MAGCAYPRRKGMSSSSNSSGAECTVLVVDDSAFMRRVISDIIDGFPGFRVVGVAADGKKALRLIEELNPDAVTLDIEMPRLNGFDVLKRVMSSMPRPVVVLSAHTAEGSRAALRALELGAVDYVTKPSGPISLDIAKVEPRLYEALEAASTAHMSAIVEQGTLTTARRLNPPRTSCGAVVAIAASTGGPTALGYVLGSLPGDLGAAVLIVQHMPPGFTTALATRLDGLASLSVAEATGGETVVPNHAWIAPANFHMRVRQVGPAVRILLDQSEPIWGTRPSADALFPTLAAAFGPRCVGVVLTGMGRDGSAGLAAIRAARGRTVAQDRESSVVYGMPGHAISRGTAERALPLRDIPAAIIECLESLED